MKRPFRYLLLIATVVVAGCLQAGSIAGAQAAVSTNLLQTPSDPIVGSYDCVRYGTTFAFQQDGTITGADGLGDGTWQATNPAQHIYAVKIRPSKMDSPERYESWTLVLESAGLTQDHGQTVVCSRAK